MLFEGVARVLEVHHPLIVTYYGQVHMLSLVQHLQVCVYNFMTNLSYFSLFRKNATNSVHVFVMSLFVYDSLIVKHVL